MSLPFNLNSVLATASLVEGFDVVRNNTRTTATGVVKVQMRCKVCGKFHTKTDK